jgi:acyl-CoA hydrolase
LLAATRTLKRETKIVQSDDFFFFNPIEVGDRVFVKASCNRAFFKDAECGVKIFAQSLGGELRHCVSAYFLVRTVDEEPLPTIVPREGDEERLFYLVDFSFDRSRRFNKAKGRMALRLERAAVRQAAGADTPLFDSKDPLAMARLIYSSVQGFLKAANSAAVDQNKWECVAEKDGVRMLKNHRKDQKDVYILQFQLNVPTKSPLEMLPYCLDFDKRSRWDKMLQSMER